MCGLPPSARPTAEDRREVGSIYWPTLAAALVQLPVAWLLSILLVRQTGGLQEMGLLNAATNWRLAVLFLPTMINQTFMPLLSNTLGAGEPTMFRRLALTNIGISTLASAVPALVIALAAAPIMGIHGPGFEAGAGVLVALAGAAVLAAASGPVGNLLIALRLAWYGTALNASTAVVTVVAYLALTDQGAQGVAWAWLIGYGWHFVASMAVMLIVFRRAVSPTR